MDTIWRSESFDVFNIFWLYWNKNGIEIFFTQKLLVHFTKKQPVTHWIQIPKIPKFKDWNIILFVIFLKLQKLFMHPNFTLFIPDLTFKKVKILEMHY